MISGKILIGVVLILLGGTMLAAVLPWPGTPLSFEKSLLFWCFGFIVTAIGGVLLGEGDNE